MQKNDIINYVKVTMEQVMSSFLFEPMCESTMAAMEKAIINGLLNKIDVDFSVNVEVEVENENDDIKSVVMLYGEEVADSMVITARYADCPVVSQSETTKEFKKEVNDFAAFERAMEIV